MYIATLSSFGKLEENRIRLDNAGAIVGAWANYAHSTGNNFRSFFTNVSAARTGQVSHFVLTDSDKKIYHTNTNISAPMALDIIENFVPNPVVNVPNFTDVSCCIHNNQELHIVAVHRNRDLYHTVYYFGSPNPRWQTFWGFLEDTRVSGSAGDVVAVGIG